MAPAKRKTAAAPKRTSPDTLVAGVLRADKRSLARAISLAEDGLPEGEALLRALYAKTGRAAIVGVTGAPGAGKSTLTDLLIARYRAKGKTVAVIAVDPTSTFTGGAILGDRIRMQKHASDDGVFIRSMATRGEMGGLARATMDAADIMDAAGFDAVLVETVGVGQDEVEIVHCAHAVLLVLTPEMGDDIQAIKAGVMEIADVFVINKADRPGADRLEARVQAMLALDASGRPQPKTVRTVASENKGLDELWTALHEALARCRSEDDGKTRALRRSDFRLVSTLRARLLDRAFAAISKGEREKLAGEILARKMNPYAAADAIMKKMGLS